MARSTAQRLAGHERRYRELAGQLADLGYISAGSITHRYTRCANPNCRCRADPPQPHGPYWQWTAKVNGKTVTRRLSDTEAALYQLSTRNGSPTTDDYAPCSPRCARSPPKPRS